MQLFYGALWIAASLLILPGCTDRISEKRDALYAAWTAERLTDSSFITMDSITGEPVIRIRSPFTPTSYGTVYRTVPLKNRDSGWYKITARIRSTDLFGQGAHVYAYGFSEQAAMLNYVASTPIKGTSDWQDITLYFSAEPIMDSLRIGCFVHGEGAASFDHIEFLPTISRPESDNLVQAYVDSFFQIVSTHALYRDSLDWLSMRHRMGLAAYTANENNQLYPELQSTLREINHHSFLIDPATAKRWTSGRIGGNQIADTLPDRSIEVPSGRWIDSNVAYLDVPAISSGHSPTLTYYAETLQREIKRLDRPGVRGWVVDLRNNPGGNCWPMLAGIGPVLGSGICGYFVKPDGEVLASWSYRDGGSYLDGRKRVQVTEPATPTITGDAKIAVLTGSGTMSSGEVVAVAFRGQDRSRSFGQPTGGFSTSNRGFMLPDSAVIQLTTSIFADRNKQEYGGPIAPDVVTQQPLEAALKWIRSK